MPDLKYFLAEMLPMIGPPVVVVSGDLTDAKERNMRTTRQIEAEWKIYAQLLADSRVLHTTAWLDLRGNHDNFDVADINSPANLYKYINDVPVPSKSS